MAAWQDPCLGRISSALVTEISAPSFLSRCEPINLVLVRDSASCLAKLELPRVCSCSRGVLTTWHDAVTDAQAETKSPADRDFGSTWPVRKPSLGPGRQAGEEATRMRFTKSGRTGAHVASPASAIVPALTCVSTSGKLCPALSLLPFFPLHTTHR